MFKRVLVAFFVVCQLGGIRCASSSSEQLADNSTTLHTPTVSVGTIFISTACFEPTKEVRDLVANFLSFMEPSTQFLVHLNAATKAYNQDGDENLAWIAAHENVHVNPRRIHVRWGTFSIVHAHLINAQYASKLLLKTSHSSKAADNSIFVMQASNMYWVRPGMEAIIRKKRCIAPFADIMARTLGGGEQAEANSKAPRRGFNRHNAPSIRGRDAPAKWAIMTRATWEDHLRRSRGWHLQRASQERAEAMMMWATQNSTLFSMGHEGFYASLANVTQMANELDELKLPSPRTFAPEEHLIASWLGTRTNLAMCNGTTLLCFKAVKGDVLQIDEIRAVASGRLGAEVFAVKRIPRLSEIEFGHFGGLQEKDGSGAPKVKVKNKRSLEEVRWLVLNMTKHKFRRRDDRTGPELNGTSLRARTDKAGEDRA